MGNPRQKVPPPKAPPQKPQRHFESSGEDKHPKPIPNPRPRPRSSPPQPPPPPGNKGRDPYENMPRVGDTQYVPWGEGGNGGTVSQTTVLGDWDEELPTKSGGWGPRGGGG